MHFYRVDDDDRLGPFNGNTLNDLRRVWDKPYEMSCDEYFNMRNKGDPTIEFDGTIFRTKHIYYGFKSIDCLYKFFTSNEIRRLQRFGYRIREYDIDEKYWTIQSGITQDIIVYKMSYIFGDDLVQFPGLKCVRSKVIKPKE